MLSYPSDSGNDAMHDVEILTQFRDRHRQGRGDTNHFADKGA